MRRIRKIVSIALLIVCFTSTLMACSNSNNVTDNNETTTTAEKVTTTEPATEEQTTKYVFKGRKFEVSKSKMDLFNDLIIKSGDVIYINDYVSTPDEAYDATRGGYFSIFMVMMNPINESELTSMVYDKYMIPGDGSICIPYADNFSFEYVGEENIIFKFIMYNEAGEAVYDVYSDYKYKGKKLELEIEKYKDYYCNLLVENGYRLYINDLWTDESSNYDLPRGYHLKMIIESMNLDNYEEIMSDLEMRYGELGDIAIPYADNYYFEYTGNDKIIFKFIKENGNKAYFDVYKLEE